MCSRDQDETKSEDVTSDQSNKVNVSRSLCASRNGDLEGELSQNQHETSEDGGATPCVSDPPDSSTMSQGQLSKDQDSTNLRYAKFLGENRLTGLLDNEINNDELCDLSSNKEMHENDKDSSVAGTCIFQTVISESNSPASNAHFTNSSCPITDIQEEPSDNGQTHQPFTNSQMHCSFNDCLQTSEVHVNYHKITSSSDCPKCNEQELVTVTPAPTLVHVAHSQNQEDMVHAVECTTPLKCVSDNSSCDKLDSTVCKESYNRQELDIKINLTSDQCVAPVHDANQNFQSKILSSNTVSECDVCVSCDNLLERDFGACEENPCKDRPTSNEVEDQAGSCYIVTAIDRQAAYQETSFLDNKYHDRSGINLLTENDSTHTKSEDWNFTTAIPITKQQMNCDDKSYKPGKLMVNVLAQGFPPTNEVSIIGVNPSAQISVTEKYDDTPETCGVISIGTIEATPVLPLSSHVLEDNNTSKVFSCINQSPSSINEIQSNTCQDKCEKNLPDEPIHTDFQSKIPGPDKIGTVTVISPTTSKSKKNIQSKNEDTSLNESKGIIPVHNIHLQHVHEEIKIDTEQCQSASTSGQESFQNILLQNSQPPPVELDETDREIVSILDSSSKTSDVKKYKIFQQSLMQLDLMGPEQLVEIESFIQKATDDHQSLAQQSNNSENKPIVIQQQISIVDLSHLSSSQEKMCNVWETEQNDKTDHNTSVNTSEEISHDSMEQPVLTLEVSQCDRNASLQQLNKNVKDETTPQHHDVKQFDSIATNNSQKQAHNPLKVNALLTAVDLEETAIQLHTSKSLSPSLDNLYKNKSEICPQMYQSSLSQLTKLSEESACTDPNREMLNVPVNECSEEESKASSQKRADICESIFSKEVPTDMSEKGYQILASQDKSINSEEDLWNPTTGPLPANDVQEESACTDPYREMLNVPVNECSEEESKASSQKRADNCESIFSKEVPTDMSEKGYQIHASQDKSINSEEDLWNPTTGLLAANDVQEESACIDPYREMLNVPVNECSEEESKASSQKRADNCESIFSKEVPTDMSEKGYQIQASQDESVNSEEDLWNPTTGPLAANDVQEESACTDPYREMLNVPVNECSEEESKASSQKRADNCESIFSKEAPTDMSEKGYQIHASQDKSINSEEDLWNPTTGPLAANDVQEESACTDPYREMLNVPVNECSEEESKASSQKRADNCESIFSKEVPTDMSEKGYQNQASQDKSINSYEDLWNPTTGLLAANDVQEESNISSIEGSNYLCRSEVCQNFLPEFHTGISKAFTETVDKISHKYNPNISSFIIEELQNDKKGISDPKEKPLFLLTRREEYPGCDRGHLIANFDLSATNGNDNLIKTNMIKDEVEVCEKQMSILKAPKIYNSLNIKRDITEDSKPALINGLASKGCLSLTLPLETQDKYVFKEDNVETTVDEQEDEQVIVNKFSNPIEENNSIIDSRDFSPVSISFSPKSQSPAGDTLMFTMPNEECFYDDISPVPKKVRIIQQESGPSATMAELDQTVPEHTEEQSAYLSLQGIREDNTTHHLVPEFEIPQKISTALFDWHRSGPQQYIIPPLTNNNDTENPSTLPCLAQLKTCSKPLRVGLSRKQRTQPLHSSFRKPYSPPFPRHKFQ